MVSSLMSVMAAGAIEAKVLEEDDSLWRGLMRGASQANNVLKSSYSRPVGATVSTEELQ